MHTTVRFVLAGQVEEISACDPTRSVLEYLREDKNLRGTKEGCAEGDCGACTVVIGELIENGIRYRAVNSCIQFLPTLDGKQLITVEDLIDSEGNLHPVQQAMVDQHGSQCGFCTPGFVMSLFSMYHQQAAPAVTRKDINLGLAGNLCRCTGYAPIIRAAKQSMTASRSDQFSRDENEVVKLLQNIKPPESLQISDGKRYFHAPRSIDELCVLLKSNPAATIVAGATDVGLWVTKQLQVLKTVIYLGEIPELKMLKEDDSSIQIGAALSYTDSMQAIARHYPAFMPLIERLGAVQVRNAGTVGGNIANGSPIGDMPPGLIAVGARLMLQSTAGRRSIDLEDFFIRYGEQDLREGEFVEQLIIPIPCQNQVFATYKISKRPEQDISAVCAAFSMQIEAQQIVQARVCFGGMAETPKRATKCEAALTGKVFNQENIRSAMLAIAEDFTPISDMRAGAEYRLKVAQNLLQRFYLEHSEKPYPVRLANESTMAAVDA